MNVAVVGCGLWGANYVRIFSELREATLVGVCDTNGERLKEVAQRFHLDRTWEALDELLMDRSVDAVVVATPSATHVDVVSRCLAERKHVLVEKPLALTVAECRRLIEAARSSQRCLMVAHTFLYNAAIRRLKAAVREEAFGPVYYVSSRRTHLGPIRADVNAVWDLAPHDVSIFGYLLESLPVSVSAVGGRFLHPSKEDVGFITLTYPGGVIGHIQASWLDSNKVREIVVVGGRKRAVFDDLNNLEKIKIFDKGVSVGGDASTFGEFQLLLRDGDIVSPKIAASEPLKNQCLHFLDCIQSGREPLSGGEAGLDVVRVMVAIERSLRRAGMPVPIDEVVP